jgi:hypothetical protein
MVRVRFWINWCESMNSATGMFFFIQTKTKGEKKMEETRRNTKTEN